MASATRKIVLASRNADKLRELRELCTGLPFEVISALDYDGLPDVIEDGTTAQGNASRKAVVTAAFTGEIAIADDTTLQVDALGGLPDVFAARFAGTDATYADNSALLLEMLASVPDGERQARFETVAVWVDPQPSAAVATGGQVVAPARQSWLRNPFERVLQVHGGADEPEFANRLADHRREWDQYRIEHGALYSTGGVDRDQVRAVLDRLSAPYLAGGRPPGADETAIQLPDTRLWTVSGPESDEPPAATVTASGLPSTAPGYSVNEPVWQEIAAEGRVLGTITHQPLGDAGFGYDPIFRPDGFDRTLAELSPEEKNAISHRGRALRRLITAVGQAYPEG